ncbi:hypothetical protein DFH05DRAFT_1004891 [Lentinula detonsa]|uniref:Secreted protein n=1 Tax=Lentinula detonsa TaxID=2804962 RepID=A0A9W8TYP1_9AGAR|nr:hypothetical protein DFH05DRAFT_1004891 [Lentinula detonsa]
MLQKGGPKRMPRFWDRIALTLVALPALCDHLSRSNQLTDDSMDHIKTDTMFVASHLVTRASRYSKCAKVHAV